jgi:hypothetical protein
VYRAQNWAEVHRLLERDDCSNGAFMEKLPMRRYTDHCATAAGSPPPIAVGGSQELLAHELAVGLEPATQRNNLHWGRVMDGLPSRAKWVRAVKNGHTGEVRTSLVEATSDLEFALPGELGCRSRCTPATPNALDPSLARGPSRSTPSIFVKLANLAHQGRPPASEAGALAVMAGLRGGGQEARGTRRGRCRGISGGWS